MKKIQSLSFLATLVVVVGMISWGSALNAQSTPAAPADQQATPSTPTDQPTPQTSPSSVAIAERSVADSADAADSFARDAALIAAGAVRAGSFFAAACPDSRCYGSGIWFEDALCHSWCGSWRRGWN